MTDQLTDDQAARDAQESASARRKRQDQQDPSGHGMQDTPRQQQQIAETDDAGSVVAEFDDEALEDLKGDNRS